MNKGLNMFVAISNIMALEATRYANFNLRYGGHDYNQIPHKHRKRKRGRPK